VSRDVRSGRFLDLYIMETREHLQLLTRSILALERGELSAVEEAFRAAHTIKGLAGAMGHRTAADTAHRLEDTLSGVRDGGFVDSVLTDGLLAAIDGLEAAIETALRGGDVEEEESSPEISSTGGEPEVAASPTTVPDGTAHLLVVRLSNDAVMPEARAELIRRAVISRDGVLGVWPLAGEPVRGVLYVFLSAGSDAGGVEFAVRAVGDVAAVTLDTWSGGEPSELRPAPKEVKPTTRDTGHARSMSVRVDRGRLDEMAEGIAELSVLHARAAQSGEQLTSYRAAAVLASLQRMILELRLVPVSTALDRVARLVRDASRAASKEIDFEVTGGEIELDQAVLDAMVDPLVHLLRNAVDHGIERPESREASNKTRRGTIRVEVSREGNSVRVLVIDDGRGVDTDAVAARGRELGLLAADAGAASEEEILRLLFHAGFSTARTVTELSGRGVGLDVVAGRIRGLGGAIEMSTRSGQGTTFTLRVPVTLSLAHSLRVAVGGEEYALPITHVNEVIPLEGTNADAWRTGTVTVRDEAVSLVDLGRVLGAGSGSPSAAVVAELGERRVALAVDRVIGHEQIVVKPFDAPVGTLPVFSGATILADGRPALLIDPLSML
jgi:two-component system chemotaxis sensor kinase CheA